MFVNGLNGPSVTDIFGVGKLSNIDVSWLIDFDWLIDWLVVCQLIEFGWIYNKRKQNSNKYYN